MNDKGINCMLAALLLVAVLFGAAAARAAEETDELSGTRNIYVGDIITLNITAAGLSADDLRLKFKDFEIIEIIEIKDKPGGYRLSVRTFDIGEYTILLNDKEIIIHVVSTLNDIQREDIFEADDTVMAPGLSFRWRMLFYISASIFALSGIFILIKAFLKRKDKRLSPYRLFLRRSGSLSVSDDGYLVDLTFYFKEYIESLMSCRIIGKTSGEIMDELKALHELEPVLPGIESWLAECDKLKFTGVSASEEINSRHYGELLRLVEQIDLSARPDTRTLQKEVTV